MALILLWALVALIGNVHCKCSLAPILGDDRSIAYACIHSDLSDLDEIANDVEWIEFSVARFANIPDDAFWRFKNLRRLTFYNCHINLISPNAFRGLNRLDWLIFHGTRLHVARAAWFHPLQNLRRLIMDRCGLIHVETDVFQMLPMLETLGLRDNDLDCLAIDELEYLRSLKTVRIDGNPWLCECRERLEGYFQQRSVIQDEELCRKGPGVYRNLQCMAQIEIPILPPQMTVHDLRTFEREHWMTRGSQFQTSVFTSLDRLPDKTSWIEISGLRIDEIPRYAFFRFGNTLRSLDLRNCFITTIEPGAFAGLHKLERLFLIGNHFPTLGGDWFRDLVGLQQLVLSNNHMRSIERTAFWNLDSVRHLDIRNNQLHCLNPNVLTELRKLERFDAVGNPWTCACRAHLERYLVDRNIGFEIGAGRCYENEKDIPPVTDGGHQQQTNITRTVTGKVHYGSFEETVNNVNVTIKRIRPTTLPPMVHHPTLPSVEIHPAQPQVPISEGTCSPDRTEKSTQIYTCTGVTSFATLTKIPTTVHTIRIILSNIPTIPAEVFARFNGYLRRLEFRDCRVERIHPQAFMGLYNLEYLSFHSNDLTSITADNFEGLKALRFLDLSRNHISRISNDVFDVLPYLVGLDISENILNCFGIEHMHRRLHYLRDLKVSANPWSCLCGTKLALSLDERQIAYDKDTLVDKSECYSQYTPGISTNGTTTVQATTTRVPTPTVTVPTIDPNEPIKGVCTTEEDNIGVRYRCSGGNLPLLNTIPAHVYAIEFYEGHLPHLPADALSRFHALQELTIRNCGLRTVEAGAFDGLENLHALTIQDNPLVTVERDWFNLQNLKRLDLRGNSIKYIAPGAFRNLNNLVYLNLEGNDLNCIFTSDLDDLPEIEVIEFSGNPLKWRCRVELEQFLELRKVKFVKIEESCEGKKIVRNLLLQNMTDFQETECSTECSKASAIEECLIMILTSACFFIMWMK